jgi:hypothetical protein
MRKSGNHECSSNENARTVYTLYGKNSSSFLKTCECRVTPLEIKTTL